MNDLLHRKYVQVCSCYYYFLVHMFYLVNVYVVMYVWLKKTKNSKRSGEI